MSFAGDLHSMDVFDLLGWLAGRKKSGLLVLSRRSTRKKLTLREGNLQASISNDPRETLGQALVRDGVVAEEALFQALLRQDQEKRRLGEILIADGLLSEEQLHRTLRANAEAHLHDLFLWPDGRFELDDSDLPVASASDLQIDLASLLEEGRRRREEWRRLRERFPSSELTFRVSGDPDLVVEAASQAIVLLAGAGKTLAAISLETRRPEYETALLVSALCDEGILAADHVEPGAPESDPVGTISALLAIAEMRVEEGRFDAALESYEKVLALDHVNQEAKKGLLNLAEARQKAKAARKVPLDQVPFVQLTGVALAQQQFSPEEGFVLSRINGQWDVRSILKLCPFPEDDTLIIFARLIERQVVALR